MQRLLQKEMIKYSIWMLKHVLLCGFALHTHNIYCYTKKDEIHSGVRK